MSVPRGPAWRGTPGGLTGGQLVLLQLLARGYGPKQVAALRGEEEGAALGNLQGALEILDVATVEEALTTALERGLIV